MTSGSALWAVQAAVYGVLSTDATLNEALGGSVTSPRVFDAVTENQAYPYLVFGRISEFEDDTFSKTGRRVALQLYIYSQYRGNYELTVAMERTAALLDRGTLTLSGWDHCGTILTRAEAAQIDGVTRAGAMELTVYVTQE